MTPENQSLVRDSFAKIEPIAPQAAAMFYDRLFVLDPSLKQLFKSDMNEQGLMLMAMIGTVVANLGNLETIIPAAQDLGKRHATYGVQPRHYETVGAALLWTLEQGLGDAFTQPVKAAWTEAYTVLSSVMQKSADGLGHVARTMKVPSDETVDGGCRRFSLKRVTRHLLVSAI